MSTLRNILLSLVMLSGSLPLNACALSGNAIEGKVLEEGTNKPVPDAIVIARWNGTAFSFVESPSVCIHTLTTTTDAEGKYRFPAWRKESPLKGVRDVHPIVTAHKPGYETHSPPGYARTEEFKQNVRYLQPFAGMREERLKYLQRVNSATGCGSASESKKNLLPLAKALYEEALGLAKTEDEKKIVNNLLFSLEIIELGYETAERRDIERRRGQK